MHIILGGAICENILLLLKPAQSQVGKIKLFISRYRNPKSAGATENLKKHNSGKQVDSTLEPIQRSGVKHSVINK